MISNKNCILNNHFQLPPPPQIELILNKPTLGVLRRPIVRIRRKDKLPT